MRISDWSSDVCSSDLSPHPRRGRQWRLVRIPKPRDVPRTTAKDLGRHSRLRRWRAGVRRRAAFLEKPMARKSKKSLDSTYVLFDVVYQDGTQTSNRKVPSAEIGRAHV